MAETKFLRFGEQAPIERGNGAVTWPLVGGRTERTPSPRASATSPMKILWVYATTNVTRAFAATGETVAHLSSDDLAAR